MRHQFVPDHVDWCDLRCHNRPQISLQCSQNDALSTLINTNKMLTKSYFNTYSTCIQYMGHSVYSVLCFFNYFKLDCTVLI